MRHDALQQRLAAQPSARELIAGQPDGRRRPRYRRLIADSEDAPEAAHL